MYITNIIYINFEFYPRTPKGNNPGTMQLRSIWMHIFFKHDPWRSMQLTHNNSLGSIYDKSPKVSQKWELPEINFLLYYVSRLLLRIGSFFTFSLPHDESQFSFEWRSISHISLNTLFHRIFWSTQRGRNEFECQFFTRISDRKNFAKYAIESKIPSLGRFFLGVHQLVERFNLNVQQVGHGHYRLQFAETDYRTSIIPSIQGFFPLLAPTHRARPHKKVDYRNRVLEK